VRALRESGRGRRKKKEKKKKKEKYTRGTTRDEEKEREGRGRQEWERRRGMGRGERSSGKKRKRKKKKKNLRQCSYGRASRGEEDEWTTCVPGVFYWPVSVGWKFRIMYEMFAWTLLTPYTPLATAIREPLQVDPSIKLRELPNARTRDGPSLFPLCVYFPASVALV